LNLWKICRLYTRVHQRNPTKIASKMATSPTIVNETIVSEPKRGILGLRIAASLGFQSRASKAVDIDTKRIVCVHCGCDEQVETEHQIMCVHDDGSGVPRRRMDIAVFLPECIRTENEFCDWSVLFNKNVTGSISIKFNRTTKASYLRQARYVIHLFEDTNDTNDDDVVSTTPTSPPASASDKHATKCRISELSDDDLEDRVFSPVHFNAIIVADRCKWFHTRIRKLIVPGKLGEDRDSAQSSFTLQLPSSRMTPIGVKLYLYLLYSGYRLPANTIIPDQIIWELYNINEMSFHNTRISQLCTSVVTQTLTDETIFSRALESYEFDNIKLFDTCVEYLCQRFDTMCTKEVFYTIPAPMMVRLIANTTLDLHNRFETAKRFLFTRSLYHSPVCPQERIDRGETTETYSKTHSECNDIVSAIPWNSLTQDMLDKTANPTTAESRDFKKHCQLYLFWSKVAEYRGKPTAA